MKPLNILVVIGTGVWVMAAFVATASATSRTVPAEAALKPASSHDLLARFSGVDLATIYPGLKLADGGVEAFCPDGRYFYRSRFVRHGRFSVNGGRLCTAVHDATGGRCRRLFRDAAGDLYTQALPARGRPAPPLARFAARGRELSRQCTTPSQAGDRS